MENKGKLILNENLYKNENATSISTYHYKNMNLQSGGHEIVIHYYAQLTNPMAYGTRRFNAAFTRALQ